MATLPTKISEDASTGEISTAPATAAPVRTGRAPDPVGAVLAGIGVREVPPTENAPAVTLPVTRAVKATSAQIREMVRLARDGSA